MWRERDSVDSGREGVFEDESQLLGLQMRHRQVQIEIYEYMYIVYREIGKENQKDNEIKKGNGKDQVIG